MQASTKPTLYLIPAPLGDEGIAVMPEYFRETVFSLKHFIVEREKTARHYLKALEYPHSLNDLVLYPLNEHTPEEDLLSFIKPLQQGVSMGLLSEAGCPGIADPGAAIVSLCHSLNIRVAPFVGPSSIILALMASGMNGQNFAFNGYLPVKEQERRKEIQRLELLSQRTHQTQIFIETPYRNNQMLKDLIQTCKPETKICIGVNITLASERIQTKTVRQWKGGTLPDLNKKPTVFLMMG